MLDLGLVKREFTKLGRRTDILRHNWIMLVCVGSIIRQTLVRLQVQIDIVLIFHDILMNTRRSMPFLDIVEELVICLLNNVLSLCFFIPFVVPGRIHIFQVGSKKVNFD